MRSIRVISLTKAYVLLGTNIIRPFGEGYIDDTNFVLSEYKSLKLLCDMKSIVVSDSDYEYITEKYLSLKGDNSGGGNIEDMRRIEDILDEILYRGDS